MGPRGRASAALLAISCALYVVGCAESTDALFAGDPTWGRSFAVQPLLDLGAVPVLGEASGVVEVRNVSDAALALEAPYLLDEDGAFALTSTGPAARRLIVPGEVAEIEVRFRPRSRGVFQAKLVAGELGGSTKKVELVGRSLLTPFEVSAAVVDLGQIPVGAQRRRLLTIRNPNGVAVDVVAQPSGDLPRCEAVPDAPLCWRRGSDTSPRFPLRARASARFEVVLAPRAEGPLSGAIVLRPAGGHDIHDVSVLVSGAGLPVAFECQPSPLEFGLIPVGTCETRRLLCRNALGAPVTIASWSATPSAFVAEPPRPVTLASGEAVLVDVEHCPERPGPVQGWIRIEAEVAGRAEVFSHELVGGAPGPVPPRCNLSVTTTDLPFGSVLVPMPAYRTLHVLNEGPEGCSVRAALSADTAAGFETEGPTSTFVLPQEGLLIPLAFRNRTAGTSTGTLELRIDDASEPAVEVPLSATSRALAPFVSRTRIDFGARALGCGGPPKQVRLHNPSEAPLVVSSLALSGDPGFALTTTVALPITIDPGHALEVSVGFTPRGAALSSASLRLAGTGEDGPFEIFVTLQAAAAVAPVHEERFTQLERRAVDVLFVVDDDGSSRFVRTQLAENVAHLLSFAARQGVDYQIGVTYEGYSTEGRLVHMGADHRFFTGPLERRIVTPTSTPSPAEVLAANIWPGTSVGDSGEMGLEVPLWALTLPHLTDANAGFLRDDARLAIVFVTQDRDHGGWVPPARPVDLFVDALVALEGQRHLSIDAIAGDVPDGCLTSNGGTAMPAPRFQEAARRTGGLFLSVCRPDWAGMLEELALRIFGVEDHFFLEHSPEPGALVVLVDGAITPPLAPDGAAVWSYDADLNAVRFSPFAVPEPGQTVTVSYSPACR